MPEKFIQLLFLDFDGYIHQNQVSAGLIIDSKDYLYITACDYAGEKGVGANNGSRIRSEEMQIANRHQRLEHYCAYPEKPRFVSSWFGISNERICY